MRRTTLWAAAAAVAFTAGAGAGCSSHTSYVESDTALGRVVVYRNGIAFYERRATVTNNTLQLTVPRDKVNDFLKSLTVADAKTGEPLPVSYPTRGATRGSDVDMTIQLPPAARRDVILTYITEAPAWKPSYRLVIGEDGNVKVQGWAIVDNTSGEDWNKVNVGVGSSSAMSFKYDLRSVRKVYRETLESEKRFAVAPPRGGATYGGGDASGKRVEFELADNDIPKPAGHPSFRPPPPAPPKSEPVKVTAKRIRVTAGGASGRGLGGLGSARPRPSLDQAEDVSLAKKKRGRRGKSRYYGKGKRTGRSYGGRGSTKSASRAPSRPPRMKKPVDMRYKRAEQERRRVLREQQRQYRQQLQEKRRAEQKVRRLAAQLKNTRGKVTIEGFANKGERSARAKSLSRANNLRNQLIKYGVAPGRLRVSGRGWLRGRGAGVRIVNDPAPNVAAAATKTSAGSSEDAAPVGESHFLSEAKLTVARGTSALVSILDAKTDGESVYLYNAAGKRGNKRYAFKSVRFKNPTDSTLETGPVTVYGRGRFIGEGLADPIPPRATAIVPYALDRQVVVDREGTTKDQISKLITLQRGVLTAEVQHVKTTKLKITNRLHTTAKVYVRHAVPKGWKLVKPPKVFDKLGRAYLFEVPIKPKDTVTVTIRQATPLTKTLSLRSAIGLDLIRVFLKAPQEVSEAFAAKMKGILGIHQEMANHKQAILSLRDRMGEYRARMNELHTQIVSLKEVKAGGALLRHLQKKMKEISERIQKATLDVVAHQEREMLARVRFQDAISELTLDAKKAKSAPKNSAKASVKKAKRK